MKGSWLAKLVALCLVFNWVTLMHAMPFGCYVDSVECSVDLQNNEESECDLLRCLAKEYYDKNKLVFQDGTNDSSEKRSFVFNIQGFMNFVNESVYPNYTNVDGFKTIIKQCSLLIGYADFHGFHRTVVYDDINDDLKLGTSDFTLETWLYIDDIPEMTEQRFVGKRGTIFSRMQSTPLNDCSGHMQGYGFYYIYNIGLGGHKLEFFMHSNNSQNSVTQPCSTPHLSLYQQFRFTDGLQEGIWTHVAVRRSNDKLELFVNGVSVTPQGSQALPIGFDVSCPSDALNPDNEKFRVGSRNTVDLNPIGDPKGPGLDYAGSFFRVMRIWKRALTDEELNSIAADRCTFNAPVNPASLVFSLPLLDPFETNPYIAFKDSKNPNRQFTFQSVIRAMDIVPQSPTMPPSLNAEFSNNCASCCPIPNQSVSTWINRDGPSKRPYFIQEEAVICTPN